MPAFFNGPWSFMNLAEAEFLANCDQSEQAGAHNAVVTTSGDFGRI